MELAPIRFSTPLLPSLTTFTEPDGSEMMRFAELRILYERIAYYH
jgi:hypothetical protein